MAKLSITASSRTGCVRVNNEDMILVGELLVRNGKMSKHLDTHDSDRFLIALADGMGGHNCGEVASADALNNLRFYFSDLPMGLKPADFNEAICEWLTSINHIMDAKGRVEDMYRGMGTTLVGVAYYGGEFYWMNCGDSRLYRLHEGCLQQVSTDHSLSNLLGQSQHSNLITNCIGGGCTNSFIDIVQFTQQVQPGDVLLLCSDGLSDMVPDEEITRLITEGFDADALCQAAEDAGGLDNISVIIVRIE